MYGPGWCGDMWDQSQLLEPQGINYQHLKVLSINYQQFEVLTINGLRLFMARDNLFWLNS